MFTISMLYQLWLSALQGKLIFSFNLFSFLSSNLPSLFTSFLVLLLVEHVLLLVQLRLLLSLSLPPTQSVHLHLHHLRLHLLLHKITVTSVRTLDLLLRTAVVVLLLVDLPPVEINHYLLLQLEHHSLERLLESMEVIRVHLLILKKL